MVLKATLRRELKSRLASIPAASRAYQGLYLLLSFHLQLSPSFLLLPYLLLTPLPPQCRSKKINNIAGSVLQQLVLNTPYYKVHNHSSHLISSYLILSHPTPPHLISSHYNLNYNYMLSLVKYLLIKYDRQLSESEYTSTCQAKFQPMSFYRTCSQVYSLSLLPFTSLTSFIFLFFLFLYSFY